MGQDALLEEIDRRLEALFTRVAEGADAPPGQLLRIEGLREAAAMCGAAEPDRLQARMAEIFAAAAGSSLEEALGGEWREAYPFPQIPLYSRRAPVVTGGGD